VRGVWDGFGLRLPAEHAAAATEVDLPAGRYRVSLRAENAGEKLGKVGSAAVPATIAIAAGGSNLARASWPDPGIPITLSGVGMHAGGKLRVELRADSEISAGTDGDPTLWITAIEVERDGP
jgi:hypothetical protein